MKLSSLGRATRNCSGGNEPGSPRRKWTTHNTTALQILTYVTIYIVIQLRDYIVHGHMHIPGLYFCAGITASAFATAALLHALSMNLFSTVFRTSNVRFRCLVLSANCYALYIFLVFAAAVAASAYTRARFLIPGPRCLDSQFCYDAWILTYNTLFMTGPFGALFAYTVVGLRNSTRDVRARKLLIVGFAVAACCKGLTDALGLLTGDLSGVLVSPLDVETR